MSNSCYSILIYISFCYRNSPTFTSWPKYLLHMDCSWKWSNFALEFRWYKEKTRIWKFLAKWWWRFYSVGSRPNFNLGFIFGWNAKSFAFYRFVYIWNEINQFHEKKSFLIFFSQMITIWEPIWPTQQENLKELPMKLTSTFLE